MAEYLSRDMLEDGLVRSFAPIRNLQTVLGSARVDAKDRFVTSPTLGQKMYTVALLIAATLSYVATACCYIFQFNQYKYLYYLCQIGMFLHFVVHTASIIHSRFFNNGGNVKFYLELQDIDRIMKIDRSSYFYDLLYRINLKNTLKCSILYLIFSTVLILRKLRLEVLSTSGIFYVQFTCTLEWIYYSNLIVHIYSRLSFINMIMLNHLRSISSFHSDNISEWKILDTRSLRELAQESNDFRISETDKYLNKIFNLIHNFTGLYRFQMFLLCFKLVVMSLATFEFCLLTLQNYIPMIAERVVLPIACVGDLSLLVFICVRWERFFKEIKETKHLATTILATYTEGPLRKKATTMLKTIEEAPPHFSVYDMWNMDGSTLLNILSIITTLIVTLLQFSLL